MVLTKMLNSGIRVMIGAINKFVKAVSTLAEYPPAPIRLANTSKLNDLHFGRPLN